MVMVVYSLLWVMQDLYGNDRYSKLSSGQTGGDTIP